MADVGRAQRFRPEAEEDRAADRLFRLMGLPEAHRPRLARQASAEELDEAVQLLRTLSPDWTAARSYLVARAADHFDAVVFVPRSTPASPTPTGFRPGRPLPPSVRNRPS